MPTLYMTGVNADGRSCILSRRALSKDEGFFEALRLVEPVVAVPSSSPDVALLASPTAPGGLVLNVFPWQPGKRVGMHRTVTTDIDVVLEGSLIMRLEEETVELVAGDCAILPGVAHAWESGAEGAIVLYCLVSGSPTGDDIGRETRPFI